MAGEVVSNYTSLVQILDGPAVASRQGELKQWYPNQEGDRYSYPQVKAASERISGLLQERGVEHGDRVMLWGPNSPQWPAAVFGILRSGAISVPFDFNGDPELFDKIFEATTPRAIIAGAEQRKSLPKEYGVPVLEMEETYDLHPQEANEYSDVDVSPDDLAQIVFTSGSTGNPKGVMLSHGNIGSNVESLAEVVPLESDNRLLSLLPLSHMFEFNPGLLTPMHLGASVVYVDTLALLRRRENLMKAMSEEHITAAAIVPRILQHMKEGIESKVAEGGKVKQELFHLFQKISSNPKVPDRVRRLLFHELHKKMGGDFEFFLVGGSHLDPSLAKYWENFGFKVLQGYGMTEASPVVTADRLREKNDHEYVGRAIPGVEIKMVQDEETGAEQIAVKGPGVMQGYWNNEEATSKVIQDGWYLTNDMGSMDSEGRLQVFGRADFMISLPSGYNVYPEDVEQVLLRENEGVLGNAMVYAEKDGGKIRLRAVLFPAPNGPEIDPDEVIRNANRNLLDYQKIGNPVVWPADEPIPQTTTRKLKRNDIKKIVDELYYSGE